MLKDFDRSEKHSLFFPVLYLVFVLE